MSFSSEVKEELAGIVSPSPHCQIAEIKALAELGKRRADAGETGGVIAVCDSGSVARKLFTLLNSAYNINVIVQRTGHRDGAGYALTAPDERDARRIRGSFEGFKVRMSCCRKAFLRGAFLASGSLNAPDKAYHFEIVCRTEREAAEVAEVMTAMGLDARTIQRKRDHVVYLKEGEQIVTALGAMGAAISLLNVESVRVLREMRGSVNRRVNCETANLRKTVESAVRQTEDIKYITDSVGLGYLDPPLRKMAEIRMKYPDMPLQELGQKLDPPLGKSGVNHRLRKISAIASELRGKRGEMQ